VAFIKDLFQLFVWVFLGLFFFGDRDLTAAQAGLKHAILLPQPPEFWNYRHAPPHPTSDFIVFSSFSTISNFYRKQLI
jgi:hypothetical protein